MSTITLISQEGDNFVFKKKWARMTWTTNNDNHQISDYILEHIDDDDDNNESLNLMIVSKRNIELLINFCKIYEEVCLSNNFKFTIPINSNDIKELLNQEKIAKYIEEVYDEKLDEDGNNKAFFDFIDEVGNYVKSYPIYCLCNYYLASLLYNKQDDEIRSIMERRVELYQSNLELVNYYLQNDKLLCLDKNLLRYKPQKLSECIGKDYYDNVVDLTINLQELPDGFVYPKALRKLYFGSYFNQEVDLSKLENLTYLHLGYMFNQELDLSNLVNLTYLNLGNYFNKEIDLSNLVNLKELELGKEFNKYIDPFFPGNLTYPNSEFELDLSNQTNLRKLTVGSYFYQNVNFSNLDNLRELVWYCNKNLDLSNLTNLTHLILGHCFNQEIINIPESLESVCLPGTTGCIDPKCMCRHYDISRITDPYLRELLNL